MRSRNLVVLAVVALLACMASSPASATVLWEDDFTGGTLDSAKWTTAGTGTATVAGGNVAISVSSGDWAFTQLTSKTTSVAADNLAYTFKIGAAPTGNYDMFQVYGGSSSAPYAAMRGDINGVNNWVFDVRQEAGVTYRGTTTTAMNPGDTWTIQIGPSGSAAYKNGVLFDSTILVPAGTLKIDAQAWHEPGTGAVSQTFDYIGVSNVVPEPGTLALIGSALLGLLCYAWRKQK